MKVLFDVRALNLYHSGIYFATRNILLQLLLRQDVEITLYAPEWCKKNERKTLLAELPSGTELNMIQPCWFHCLAAKGVLWAARRQDCSIGTMRLFYNLIRIMCYLMVCCIPAPRIAYSDYDVYFSPYLPPPEKIRTKRNLLKYVLLYDTTPILFPQFFSRDLKNGWYADLTRSLNKEDNYFSISESTKRDFLRLFPDQLTAEKITVIPLGTHKNFTRQTDVVRSQEVLSGFGIGEGQKYFFSLCSIESHKNLLHSVECFVQMIDSQDDKELLFVLGGAVCGKETRQIEIQKRLEALAKQYPQIRMIGYVPDEDLATLYSNAECFIFCSLYEGFGLPILEAMLCGCPVICSNVSSMPEVAGDAALLVDPAQKDQLVDAMKQVHQDAALREKMRDAGLVQAAKFSYKNAAEVIVRRMTADLDHRCPIKLRVVNGDAASSGVN